ncbi:hypothetical protein BDZ91DRAFT_729411 [Kalaharituber pfeilii]|nr:hypothetical protein BDZ91DRAFT_729411 [Kalaharituber pfeilii]
MAGVLAAAVTREGSEDLARLFLILPFFFSPSLFSLLSMKFNHMQARCRIPLLLDYALSRGCPRRRPLQQSPFCAVHSS